MIFRPTTSIRPTYTARNTDFILHTHSQVLQTLPNSGAKPVMLNNTIIIIPLYFCLLANRCVAQIVCIQSYVHCCCYDNSTCELHVQKLIDDQSGLNYKDQNIATKVRVNV